MVTELIINNRRFWMLPAQQRMLMESLGNGCRDFSIASRRCYAINMLMERHLNDYSDIWNSNNSGYSH